MNKTFLLLVILVSLFSVKAQKFRINYQIHNDLLKQRELALR